MFQLSLKGLSQNFLGGKFPDLIYSLIFKYFRYLAIEGHLIKKPKIQLVGVCAMLIACKYEEMYIPQVEDFVYISDEAYKAQEILSMVRKFILKLYKLEIWAEL